MKHKIRDYSAKTIEEFKKYMDKYYSKESGKIKKFWDGAKHWLGFFTKNKDKINGDAEKYIKSLTDRRSETEQAIVRTWKEIAAVERQYSADFGKFESMCEAYVNAAKKATEVININSFSSPASFGGLLNSCADEYMRLIETKVENILKKSVDDLTDADIEILAYVAMNTADEELKGRIYNAFYNETTDEHITYAGEAPNYQPFHYYDRNEEKWQKFVACEKMYYSSYYADYLNGKISDGEINDYIKNHMAIQYLNDNGKMLFVGKENGPPITIGKSGEISVVVPKKEKVRLRGINDRPWNPNSSYADRWDPDSPFFDSVYQDIEKQIPRDASIFGEDMKVQNGQNASNTISDKQDQYIEDTIDWAKFGENVYKYVGKKIADTILPGSGEVLDAIKDYGYDPAKKANGIIDDITDYNEKNSPTYLTDSQKTGYKWFITKFNVKCVINGDSYTLLPSQKTYGMIDEMLVQMKSEHPDMYRLMGIPADEAARNGKTEAEWLFDAACKNPDVLYRNFEVIDAL